MSKKANLAAAKAAKNDEFYTPITEIEKEMKHFRKHFSGKVVLCNCDDPEWSNFWLYFSLNFETLGLKKLISTHFETDKQSYKLTMVEGGKTIRETLRQNGDFRSPECIELLEEADIVVTNPPFSLFREFIYLMDKKNKKFLVLGNTNSITYKEIFKLIMQNRLWLGSKGNATMEFRVPEHYPLNSKSGRVDEQGNKFIKVPSIAWYTNLEHSKRNEEIICYKEYNELEYRKYENYDAINVDRVSDIPMDYYGEMGVPITFLDKYNPKQFEIIRFRKGNDDKDLRIEGRSLYFRIIIKRREK